MVQISLPFERSREVLGVLDSISFRSNNKFMQHLSKLFKLLELTRSMPQYGYALGGIKKEELSDLAQHQYLVTFIAWQLARNIKKQGFEINIERVMELALIHDLGELFGSDINYFYGRLNKKAKKAARQFENENIKFLSHFFGSDKNYFQGLAKELFAGKSLETVVAKISDYIEALLFKKYVGALSKKYDENDSAFKQVSYYTKNIKDTKLKKIILDFLKHWTEDLPKGEALDWMEK